MVPQLSVQGSLLFAYSLHATHVQIMHKHNIDLLLGYLVSNIIMLKSSLTYLLLTQSWYDAQLATVILYSPALSNYEKWPHHTSSYWSVVRIVLKSALVTKSDLTFAVGAPQLWYSLPGRLFDLPHKHSFVTSLNTFQLVTTKSIHKMYIHTILNDDASYHWRTW